MEIERTSVKEMSRHSIWLGVPEATLGVIFFSLTTPAIKLAVRDFHPMAVGIGRAVVAALQAAITLLVLGSVTNSFPRC